MASSSPIRMSGLTSGLDTESIVTALTSNYQTKVDNYTKQQTKLSWTQDKWKDLNKKVNSLYNSLSSMKYSSGYASMKATVSDSTKATVSAGVDATTGSHTLEVGELAQTASRISGKLATKAGGHVSSGTKLSELGYTGDDEELTLKDGNGKSMGTVKITKDTTVSDIVSGLKSAGIQANFDETNQRIYLNAKQSGAAGNFSLSESGASGDTSVLSLLKLGDAPENTADAEKGNYATVRKGQDAAITLDGVEYTGGSNTFSINGLNITATGKTNGEVTVGVDQDVDGLYDKIKDFFSQYNEVINALSEAYNADSARGYEPLTDTEKEAMSDSQVEKYEDKIKASLLRNDTTLDGIINSMTSAMYGSYTVKINGKDQNISLSQFGIHTLGVLGASDNEQYAYHIDGDEDDANTSSNKDKLKAALSSDPDSVIDLMKQVATKLSDNIYQKMKGTELRTTYTIYNDKQMASEYSDYTDLIKEWTTRLNDAQDSYYKKFSKMESALSSLQSNSSSLTNMFS